MDTTKRKKIVRKLDQAIKDNPYVFTFQRVCADMSTASASQLREAAKRFDLPPETWNDKNLICALLTPIARDMVALNQTCDNSDETSLVEFEEWKNIPNYLKYSRVINNRTYCYYLFDLYSMIKQNESGESLSDPYRRFKLTPDIQRDIIDRVEFLRAFLTPEDPAKIKKRKLEDMIVTLNINSFKVEEIYGISRHDVINHLFTYLFCYTVMGEFRLKFNYKTLDFYSISSVRDKTDKWVSIIDSIVENKTHFDDARASFAFIARKNLSDKLRTVFSIVDNYINNFPTEHNNRAYDFSWIPIPSLILEQMSLVNPVDKAINSLVDSLSLPFNASAIYEIAGRRLENIGSDEDFYVLTLLYGTLMPYLIRCNSSIFGNHELKNKRKTSTNLTDWLKQVVEYVNNDHPYTQDETKRTVREGFLTWWQDYLR